MLFKFQYGFAIPIVAIVGLRRHSLAGRMVTARTGRATFAGSGCRSCRGRDPARVILPFGLDPDQPGRPAHSLVRSLPRGLEGVPRRHPERVQPLDEPVLRRDPGRLERADRGPRRRRHGGSRSPGLGVTWQTLGNLLFASAVLIALAVFARRSDGIAIVVVALTIAVAFFVLPTRIHERYLYPALALGLPLLAAGIAWRRLYVALTAILFLDVYWVYTLPHRDAGPGSRDPGRHDLPAGGHLCPFGGRDRLDGLAAVAGLAPMSLPWAATARGSSRWWSRRRSDAPDRREPGRSRGTR